MVVVVAVDVAMAWCMTSINGPRTKILADRTQKQLGADVQVSEAANVLCLFLSSLSFLVKYSRQRITIPESNESKRKCKGESDEELAEMKMVPWRQTGWCLGLEMVRDRRGSSSRCKDEYTLGTEDFRLVVYLKVGEVGCGVLRAGTCTFTVQFTMAAAAEVRWDGICTLYPEKPGSYDMYY